MSMEVNREQWHRRHLSGVCPDCGLAVHSRRERAGRRCRRRPYWRGHVQLRTKSIDVEVAYYVASAGYGIPRMPTLHRSRAAQSCRAIHNHPHPVRVVFVLR